MTELKFLFSVRAKSHIKFGPGFCLNSGVSSQCAVLSDFGSGFQADTPPSSRLVEGKPLHPHFTLDVVCVLAAPLPTVPCACFARRL